MVEDRQVTGNLLVRARHRVDLANLQKRSWQLSPETDAALFGAPIIETPQNDYPFRLSLPRAVVAELMLALVTAIDYSNFKSRIHDTPGQANKNKAYMEVWSAMRRSEGSPRKGNPFLLAPPLRSTARGVPQAAARGYDEFFGEADGEEYPSDGALEEARDLFDDVPAEDYRLNGNRV